MSWPESTRRAPQRATDDERAEVRTITFRSASNHEGTVTGIPLNDDWVMWRSRVWMYSAGCLHNVYIIPPGSTILSVERHG